MGGTLYNCLLSDNLAISGYGGGAFWSATLNNCILVGNSANYGGGAYSCTLNNCTVCTNYGNISFASGGGAYGCTLNNCIVYYNTGASPADACGCTLNYCCTPDPGGVGCFTNAPLFVNQASDFHLQSNSPCINSGNNGYVATTTDLDGNPRIVGGTVDMGAYEFQKPTSVISYAWLQQYGLPTDGSADYTDPDGDGMNNWQEWIAGTDPTNAQSVLRIVQISTGTSGTTLTWQSSNSRTYFIQRSAGMGAPSSFQPLASNIVGQAGSTTFTDTNVVPNASVFYRVGVQQ
jgi:hypothetical protein